MRSDKGFSLLEVMVAVAVLAVGMLGVATLLTSAMQSGRYSYQARTGDSTAFSYLDEKVKAIAVDGSIPTVNDLPKNDSKDAYHFKWEIRPDTPATGVDRVDLTVGWGGADCGSGDSVMKCKHRTSITNYVLKSLNGS